MAQVVIKNFKYVHQIKAPILQMINLTVTTTRIWCTSTTTRITKATITTSPKLRKQKHTSRHRWFATKTKIRHSCSMIRRDLVRINLLFLTENFFLQITRSGRPTPHQSGDDVKVEVPSGDHGTSQNLLISVFVASGLASFALFTLAFVMCFCNKSRQSPAKSAAVHNKVRTFHISTIFAWLLSSQHNFLRQGHPQSLILVLFVGP